MTLKELARLQEIERVGRMFFQIGGGCMPPNFVAALRDAVRNGVPTLDIYKIVNAVMLDGAAPDFRPKPLQLRIMRRQACELLWSTEGAECSCGLHDNGRDAELALGSAPPKLLFPLLTRE